MIDTAYMHRIAAAEDIELSPAQLQQLDTYAAFLVAYNEKVNLTAITGAEEIAQRHFLDSLLFCKLLPTGTALIDIGTGAGFPGMVAKVFDPSLQLTLLDSLQKRLVFLQQLAEKLGFGDEVQLVHARAEEAGRDRMYREQYPCATARAVANLAVLCEYCLPYVQVGGTFYALKGPDGEPEGARRRAGAGPGAEGYNPAGRTGAGGAALCAARRQPPDHHRGEKNIANPDKIPEERGKNQKIPAVAAAADDKMGELLSVLVDGK